MLVAPGLDPWQKAPGAAPVKKHGLECPGAMFGECLSNMTGWIRWILMFDAGKWMLMVGDVFFVLWCLDGWPVVAIQEYDHFTMFAGEQNDDLANIRIFQMVTYNHLWSSFLFQGVFRLTRNRPYFSSANHDKYHYLWFRFRFFACSEGDCTHGVPSFNRLVSGPLKNLKDRPKPPVEK